MKRKAMFKKSISLGLAVLLAATNLSGTVYATEVDNIEQEVQEMEPGDDDQTTQYSELSAKEVEDENSVNTLGLTEVESIADTDSLRTIVVNIGENRNELSFTWIGTSNNTSYVEIKQDGQQIEKVQATQLDCTDTIGGYSYSARLNCFNSEGTYEYRVGNDDTWSEYKTLTIGKEDSTYSFLLSGDPQIYSTQIDSDTAGWVNTMNLASQWFDGQVSFLMTLGDQVNASRSGYLENEYDALTAPEMVGELPMAMNVGNHDVYTYSSYSEHFTVPENVDSNTATAVSGDQSGDYWYAYEGTLFMSLNSNNTSTASHISFMEQAIADYTAQHGTPTWQIVSFHHSIYSSASHHDDADIIVRRNELSPEFTRLNIDVVLMGHDHVHTRSVMMQGTAPTDLADNVSDAPLDYVMDPADGAVFYLTLNSGTGSKFYDIENYELDYVAYKNQENIANITKVDVNDESLVFTTYRTDIGSQKEDIVDSFSIIRSSTKKFL